MKKILLLTTAAFFILVWRYSDDNIIPSVPRIKSANPNKSRPVLTKAAVKKPNHKIPIQPTPRAPASDLAQFFLPNPEIDVGKNYIFASDLGAIAKPQYNPQLGPLISEDKNWSYYKKSPNEVSIPVAYHPSKNKFYPISSIIQVKDVGSDLRDDLLSSGLQEYHYHKKIKLLFVESSPEEVLKTYEQIKQRGLKAELEVLSERPKAH